ncbi:hypothetical protein TTHERM_00641140 (macronuclear) [Tetrahymena thermophila SB210]|uniref:Uncharacterized protein n=1 Tax=Tetrahymena thermophila (strain SB210) TaxID=312017 RepID=Q23F18_TETTS|nr:hypothetical protein TTHERM_00641140 [Tetrahymena thermophila SB210]EAR95087.1 hypothetical protein TTHERM_00641140 [Tetrahymena thermophila SB210]|eukprot:XP_001015332.1 hypothetical protein TTHERM_00641140 [Tetrahymena thermophila SB210]
MSEMILQEKKQETNREFEIYLQLQKGLQEQQPAQENLQNLFEIEDLLKRTEDEQLINTIYLHLTKQFHHFNQNVQYQIYLVFQSTAESKYQKVFNKNEVLDMLQDHIRSLDQMTRTIAIKIVGLLTPFYLTSIETFHLIIDILLKSDYHEEINSSIHVLGNFVEGGSSNEFALRLLNKGDLILNKCGEGVYLDLLNRVKLHNRVIQINFYKQVISLICSNPSSSLRKKLKLIIRACRSNQDIAIDFFNFCEDNFEQFASEEPQFINKHVSQSSSISNDGSSSLSQTLIKLSAKSKSGVSNSGSSFNQKLKNLGKSLNQILEKKAKSAALEKQLACVVEAILLVYEWTRHFSITPSHFLNEKIIKNINKFNIQVTREYILFNEDVDKSEFSLTPSEIFSNPAITSKSILINIHNLVRSEERRRCLNILEMDDYDCKYIDKNFQCLQQVTLSLATPNDAALLFKSFSNTFHKLSFQIISKNHENIQEFYERHYPKFACLLAFLSPIGTLQIYQNHIVQLLKDRIFKMYFSLFKLAIQNKYYAQFFNIVNLTVCHLYNKLIDKSELQKLITSEFIMNLKISDTKSSISEIKLLKKIASQFAVYNLYESAHSILSIIKILIKNLDSSVTKVSIQDENLGNEGTDEEKLDFQMKLLSLLQQTDKQVEDQIILKLYDILLLFSKESCHIFETQFMEFFCSYYQYLQDPSQNENFTTVLNQIEILLSNKFNIDATSKASIRFIQKLIYYIDKNLSVLSQKNKPNQSENYFQYSGQMEEEGQSNEEESALKEELESILADRNSRYRSRLEEEDADFDIGDYEAYGNYQLDYFIDGRQNLVEKLLANPNKLIQTLKQNPLIIPRSLFVQKNRQPSIKVQIIPLSEYSVRAEKGLFLNGQIYLNNFTKKLDKSKIQLKVEVKQEILAQECIQKHISTRQQIINNCPTPKIFSEKLYNNKKENQKLPQNQRSIPFSTLILFPHIGHFNIHLQVELICHNTSSVLITSHSQLIQIKAI